MSPVRVDGVDIAIEWRTTSIVAARVRDDVAGVCDVRCAPLTGWSCSCADGPMCHHVGAVRQLTEEV